MSELRTLDLPLDSLVAMKANQKSLGEVLRHIPLLAVFVANPLSARSLVTFTALATSAAHLASCYRISNLSPLGRQLRLLWFPVSPMRLSLLTRLSL